MFKDPIDQAKEVLKIEAEGILHLLDKIDSHFALAVETIFRSKGRVIVTGIGKSGLIGRKIVATLTSTGTPALFLHPVEGMHGDLGIVTRDDVLVVAVSDNGPGIAPDELKHVFGRFYRARHGRQQHSGGTGLGLAICKAFIEAHGGAIWAESNGRGTTISFSLPLTALIQDGNDAANLAMGHANAAQSGDVSPVVAIVPGDTMAKALSTEEGRHV